MEQKLYVHIAQCVGAHTRCNQDDFAGDTKWLTQHRDRADALCKEFLPHGSGFDSGVELNWEDTKPERLVFHAPHHDMDEQGGYSDWSEYTVIVTPSLENEIDLRVTGGQRKYRDHDYVAETMHHALKLALSNETVNNVYRKVDE